MCEEHHVWDPDCGECTAQREHLTKGLANASAEIADIMNRMAAMGVNVPFNEIVLSQRLETLIDMVLGTDTKSRLILEHAAGARILDNMRGAAQAIKSQNGGLYVPDSFRRQKRG